MNKDETYSLYCSYGSKVGYLELDVDSIDCESVDCQDNSRGRE